MSESLQGSYYDEHQQYAAGSPHLRHRHLHASLLALVFGAVEEATRAGLPPRVLEIGGGDGGLTEPLLANGLEVTATEMSAVSVATMEDRFRHNQGFQAVYDPDGSLSGLGDTRFSCVLFGSVLHHIPDYLAAISQTVERHLSPGGSLVALQDPLWYPRMSNATRRLSSASYLSWRVFQGGLARGVRTRVRRSVHGISEDEVGDAVEYHVVRNGVDDQAVAELLGRSFETVDVQTYWSTQGRAQQRLGEALGAKNTFAVVACAYRGDTDSKSRSA
jgi:SAM-dependent methyltransferase